MAYEVFEELEFLRLKVDGRSRTAYRTPDKIDLDVPGSRASGHVGADAGGPPRQRVPARYQLRHRDRLHEIVVTACLEPVNAIADAPERCEEEHGYLHAAIAQLP